MCKIIFFFFAVRFSIPIKDSEIWWLTWLFDLRLEHVTALTSKFPYDVVEILSIHPSLLVVTIHPQGFMTAFICFVQMTEVHYRL